MDTVSMVYSKYINNCDTLNYIFGEGNWLIHNYLDQLLIYCGYFGLSYPSATKINMSKEILYITFIDNPKLDTLFEKHPKLDRNKTIMIHICNNNEKFIIHAKVDKNNVENKHSRVILNKMNVLKLNVLQHNIGYYIKSCISMNNFKDLRYYSLLNNMIDVISETIRINEINKEELKEKYLKAIAKIDEMFSIDMNELGLLPRHTAIDMSEMCLLPQDTNITDNPLSLLADVSFATSVTVDNNEPPAKKNMGN